MLIALTREVSRRIGECQLTHLEREPIDYESAVRQHSAYEAALAALGCTVRRLPAADELPDSVFVEDAAVVVPELAVLARSGAESRRNEVVAAGEALADYRQLARIAAPATLDGGDVLRVGRSVYAGLSSRTNREGVAQLRALLAPHGYTVTGVTVEGALHLKSAVTAVGEELLLLNPAWIDRSIFDRFDQIESDPAEPFAANALRVAGAVIVASAFPRTRERLQTRGLDVRAVDAGELAKAEGGVTCCSIVFEA